MKPISLLIISLLLSGRLLAQPLCLSPEEYGTHRKQLDGQFAPDLKLFPAMINRQPQLGGFYALGPEERRFRLATNRFTADLQQQFQAAHPLKDTSFVITLHLYLQPDGRVAHFAHEFSRFRSSAVVPEQAAEVQKLLCAWLQTYRYPFETDQPYRLAVTTATRRRPVSRARRTVTTLAELRQTTRPDTVTVVSLNQQELTQVPEEILRFTRVEQINLAGNELTTVPEALFTLPRLKRLDLTGNRLTETSLSIPPGSELTFLNLQYNNLTEIPASIGNCRRLTSLWLGHNPFSRLNLDVLYNLKKLQDLNLYNAGLKELPEEIGRLKRLQILDLYHNQLRELPGALCRLRRLEQLAVSDNKLGKLPEKLHRMRRLQKIYAHHNFLASLPERLRRSRRLRLLDVGYNAFTYVPPVVTRMKSLRELDMGHNRLTELPPRLLDLPRLQKCYVRGNPLTQPPQLTAVLPLIQQLEANRTEVFY